MKPLSKRFIASSKCGSEWHLRKIQAYYAELRRRGVKLRKTLAK